MNTYIFDLKKKLAEKNYSDDYISIVVQYASRLIQNQVPVIFDFKHLAHLLNIDLEYLRRMTWNASYYYREIVIPKKNGAYRNIDIPTSELKAIQRWILKYILYSVKVSSCAKGFKKDVSIVHNALPHSSKEVVVNLDIKDFFPAISSHRVYKIFRYLGYTKQISSILSSLTTKDGALPQGAPTSPYLSNIVCKKLDKRLSSLIKDDDRYNYTRYADDLTFSGDRYLLDFIPTMYKIIQDEDFIINHCKTRIQFANNRQTVTGLVVNGSRVTVPKKYVKDLRQEIYYCKKYGVTGHMQRRNIQYSNYKEHLLGKAFFIKMVDKILGEKFLEELVEIDWDY